MSDVKLSNIPQMNVGKLVNDLGTAYTKIIKDNLPVTTMPSVMLWGAPGVGKSQAVRQIAKKIEEDTNKRVNVTDVRLLLFNPIDLRGIPTSNADKTLAIWLKPQIFQMDPSEEVVNILFLDEISAAPQSVQAAAYQITLDRVVGEHKLPDNCIVLAAGNRITDKSVAFSMPKALANRLLHIDVEGNFDSWRKWAIETGINPKVIGFLSYRKDYLMNFQPESEDLAFPTPRVWEMISRILNGIDDNPEKVFSLISGLVGKGVGVEFRTYCKVFNNLPNIEDIFEGQTPKPPESTDAMYALVSALTVHAKENKDDLTKIENSIKYAEQLPPDFAAVLMKDYAYLDKDYKRKLMKIPAYQKWMETRGKLMNGSVR